MPIYVYKNMNTGETFEIEQRITEAALTVHPETGDPVKRMIQSVGIAFKGSGFYVNDSRSSASTSKSSTAKTDTKPENKSETKTETKSEAKADSSPKKEAPASKA